MLLLACISENGNLLVPAMKLQKGSGMELGVDWIQGLKL